MAERFTGIAGRYVPLKETVRGFREILDGKCDDLPEQAFMMAGTIEDVREKADKTCQGCVIIMSLRAYVAKQSPVRQFT